VNVEQAPKTLVVKADLPPEKGRPLFREFPNDLGALDFTGVMTMARGKRTLTQHGRSVGAAVGKQPTEPS
jgi:hypothetical protein